jgi:hypothetical protein
MIDRRSLLGMLAGSAVLGPMRQSDAGVRRIGDIGLQLYTVRRELQRNFEGTFARIAQIGYREVEDRPVWSRAPCGARDPRSAWAQGAFISREL